MSREAKRAQHKEQESNDPRADLTAADFFEVCADVNLEYGGTFIRPVSYTTNENRFPDYFDLIEIVDLDSACGASGVNLVELKSVSIDFTRPDERRNYQSALDCHGMSKRDVADLARSAGKRAAQCMIAYILASYGSNTDTENAWIAITDPSAAHGSREAYQWIKPTQNPYAYTSTPTDVIPDHGDAALSLAINAAISAA